MNNENYSDIIDTLYPFPGKRAGMSMENRAAQFSSFAALRGHKEQVKDAAKENTERYELKEDATDINSYFDI